MKYTPWDYSTLLMFAVVVVCLGLGVCFWEEKRAVGFAVVFALGLLCALVNPWIRWTVLRTDEGIETTHPFFEDRFVAWEDVYRIENAGPKVNIYGVDRRKPAILFLRPHVAVADVTEQLKSRRPELLEPQPGAVFERELSYFFVEKVLFWASFGWVITAVQGWEVGLGFFLGAYGIFTLPILLGTRRVKLKRDELVLASVLHDRRVPIENIASIRLEHDSTYLTWMGCVEIERRSGGEFKLYGFRSALLEVSLTLWKTAAQERKARFSD